MNTQTLSSLIQHTTALAEHPVIIADGMSLYTHTLQEKGTGMGSGIQQHAGPAVSPMSIRYGRATSPGMLEKSEEGQEGISVDGVSLFKQKRGGALMQRNISNFVQRIQKQRQTGPSPLGGPGRSSREKPNSHGGSRFSNQR